MRRPALAIALGLLLVAGFVLTLQSAEPVRAANLDVWPTCSYQSIQEAIDAAGDGDTIRVAQGVYTENITVDKEVVLEGGYESVGWTRNIAQYETVIDGSQIDSVVRFEPGSDGSVVDGFTIQNGKADNGGGILSQDTYVTIRQSRIVSNTATVFGGGIVLLTSRVTIDRCMIQGNQAGDAGGGIDVDGSTVTITASMIAANTAAEAGGGVRVVGLADSLGILKSVNSLIVGNDALSERGGGIEFGYSYQGELTNLTIADNEAPVGGGVAKAFDLGDPASVKMTNTIVFFNEGGDLLGSYVITFSDIGEEVSGEGNISTDPLFVDRAGGDYHLQVGSPCIDAGTNDGAPNTDFDGDSRPLDGDLDGVAITDMGADEFKPSRIYLPLVLKNVGG